MFEPETGSGSPWRFFKSFLESVRFTVTEYGSAGSHGDPIGAAGVTSAIKTALPRCPALRLLEWDDCSLDAHAKQTLRLALAADVLFLSPACPVSQHNSCLVSQHITCLVSQWNTCLVPQQLMACFSTQCMSCISTQHMSCVSKQRMSCVSIQRMPCFSTQHMPCFSTQHMSGASTQHMSCLSTRGLSKGK